MAHVIPSPTNPCCIDMGKGTRIKLLRKGSWREGSICDVSRKYHHLVMLDFEVCVVQICYV